MCNFNFISQADFENHVASTIETYSRQLSGINLQDFNSNVIDPIKLLFDKNVFNKEFEEIINLEIQRQRDKSNTNAIGYFHQNMFRYIENCEVPLHGWDVIYTSPTNGEMIYVEMKNKHNTMNSSSSQKTYITMQNKIVSDPHCECYLVEVLAPNSRNITWQMSVNGSRVANERIRRVSLDQFYALVTGERDAFYQICMQLPRTIEKIIALNPALLIQEDSVIDELRQINPDTLLALYKLAFETYEGFENL